MKLKKVIVENFRSYNERIEVEIENLTTFIGQNDVGKSTILEALEIFFNNETVKIEQQDACVHNDNKTVKIGCVFTDLPGKIILDASSPTTLEKEYLLNEDEELEIHKIYNCERKTIKPDIFINAKHPANDGAADLFELKLTGLKKRLKELEVDESEIDLRSNVSIREAIRNHFDQLEFVERALPLKTGDAVTVWENIEKILPIFALFQSDRSSSDDDSEVQDPLKIAVKEALSAAEDELNKVKEAVQEKVLSIAEMTLEKLHEMAPDLANELTPKFKEEPKWEKLFKLNIDGDDQIPINKRGSGVRRLILLNFFRAEAERKKHESDSKNVIYAIEEPETSQHPNNQKLLASAFKELAEDGNNQVILTTHVPAFAELLPCR